MSELRVPTVAVDAEVMCSDGQQLRGQIFLPASAAKHFGPMRPEEWINEPLSFAPFRIDGGEPIILNKHEILALTVTAADDPPEDGLEGPERAIAIDCLGHRFEGSVIIDMPPHQCRVLDYLNRPGDFLVLRDGERHHLIRKQRISRVEEKRV